MQEKIVKALENAKNYIDASLEATKKSDEKANHIWHAISELEYALFLFSITNQNYEVDKSTWKLDTKTKQMSPEELLKTVLDFVENALENMESKKLELAHRNTWMARGYLLTVQNELEKTRQQEKKKVGKESK